MTGPAGAVYFIVETLLSLLLFVFLLRVLLQLTRADFRNPLSQAVVKITNPVVMPLRKVLPPMGKLDTASIVAVFIVATIKMLILAALAGVSGLSMLEWAARIGIEVVRTTLRLYTIAIFVYALLGMIAPGGYSPMQSLLGALCEPVLRPFRRIIPPIANIDFSPLWALIVIQALIILLGW